MLSKFIGSMIGMAIGDALGAPVEFKIRDAFEPVTDMRGNGTWDLPPGYWTDDTSMALCMADSFIEKRAFDARDQIERYIGWWRKGENSSTGTCFDIGNSTYQALSRYEREKKTPFCGLSTERSAGNGSIMRLAPAALFYADDVEFAADWCGKSSKTTHSHRSCIDACRYYGGLIIGALKGIDKDILLYKAYHPSGLYWQPDALEQNVFDVAEGSYKSKSRKTIGSSGYIIETLEAALWAFYNTSTFEEGALLVVNLGGDTDTTGAVYGQLAGAYYGEAAIPKKWKEVLYKSDYIAKIATDLYDNRWVKNSNA